MSKKPNILICPLDWGIGHATRCIPLINELIQQQAKVIIGADNLPYALLKEEFPQLQFVRFPGYKFHYPGNDKMAFKMAQQSPAILSGIRSENRTLRNLIQEFKIDAVISDNRFGLYNDKIPSVFLTHQITIKVPSKLAFAESILYKLNKHFITKYDECWIPDWEEDFSLSGDLSHQKPKLPNMHFIGPLSRFGKQKRRSKEQNYKYKFAVIISGPEPQRSIFEKLVLEQTKYINEPGVVVLGKPGLEYEASKSKNPVIIYPHLNSNDLEDLILDSKIIFCRPGYSSIMDLVALGKKAVFIPTPGQTEQEYLAEYYFNNHLYFRMLQHEFDINTALKETDSYQELHKQYDSTVLKERMIHLLNKL